MTEELFRCQDLLVRKVAAGGGACCVVTFDSFTDHRTLDRPGFGEHFLRSRAIDAIHVIPRENDWYGHPEMAAAMACVHASTRGYARVVTYGSSMGAYAAIRFAGLAGARAVLALSPQFSIDPAVAPWEYRWTECGKRFDGRWERSLPFPSVDDACVVHDPMHRLDARHVAALSGRFRFEGIEIPHAGHPVTGCLVEIGLLHALILETCRGRLDKAAFRARALERLPTSPQHLMNLARTLPRRRGGRLGLMRQAVALGPDDPSAHRGLGVELRYAKLFEESLAMHRRSLELAPGHPNMLLEYALSLESSGQGAAAVAVLEDLCASTGGTPIYRAALDQMRTRVRPRARAWLARWRVTASS